MQRDQLFLNHFLKNLWVKERECMDIKPKLHLIVSYCSYIVNSSITLPRVQWVFSLKNQSYLPSPNFFHMIYPSYSSSLLSWLRMEGFLLLATLILFIPTSKALEWVHMDLGPYMKNNKNIFWKVYNWIPTIY